MGTRKNVDYFKERLSRLKEWQGDDPCDEVSISSLNAILKIAKDAAICHTAYHHYTTVAAIKKIFALSSQPSLRLTRISSAKLNDHNECDKYASEKSTSDCTFIVCFNHESAESANLWWLYARGDSESVRITIPQKDFVKWCGKFNNSEMLVSDVVYAAVKGMDDRYPQKRQNVLAWEDQRIRILDLASKIRSGCFTGRFKDYEWRSEAETRFIKTGSENSRYEFVEIPAEVIPNLRITTSPWASEKVHEKIRRIAERRLGQFGWKATRDSFRPSVLAGAMNYLKRFVSLPGGCWKGDGKKQQ